MKRRGFLKMLAATAACALMRVLPELAPAGPVVPRRRRSATEVSIIAEYEAKVAYMRGEFLGCQPPLRSPFGAIVQSLRLQRREGGLDA